MNKVIIKFAMFSIPQNVYLEDENGNFSKFIMPLEEIPGFIAAANCSAVYTYGPKPFCMRLERDVKAKFDKQDILWYYNDKDKIQNIVKKAKEEN